MNENCFPIRPVLTEHLLLGMPLPEDISRHLDQCPDCTREVSEIGDVVRTLHRADPLAGWTDARTPETAGQPSRDLGDRIRRDLAAAKTARPGRRRQRVALGLAAAFVTAAAVVIPIATHQDQASDTSVVLVRQGQMVDRQWGTEVPVALSGLQVGEMYHVMAVNSDGTRASGGSVRAATDERVSLRMVTAMQKDTITALIVEDEEGRVVTRVPVTPSPSR